MNDLEIVLPEEIKIMAESVAGDKKAQVLAVITSVFSEVKKMKSQLNTITVADENDKTSMKLANTIRLEVRRKRIDSEKIIDAKREEVKQQMASYKTEDTLWLKTKQMMQALAKEVEELAKYKEDTAERIKLERIEAVRIERQNKLVKYSEFVPEGIDLSVMDDDGFEKLLSGAKLQKKAKEDAEAAEEAERARVEEIERLRWERADKIKPFYHLFTDPDVKLGELTEEEFSSLYLSLEEKKKEYDAKQEAQRLENESLKKEREELKKAAIEEDRLRKKEAAERAKKEAAEKEKHEAELKKEREEKERIERELKAKQKAEQDRIEAEKAAKEKTEQDELKKGDSEKVAGLIAMIESIQTKFTFKSKRYKAKYEGVNNLLTKVIEYIKKD